ncbi:MAG: hypothetical protein N2482_02920, partial [Patescibacteria group bacterium]|nr:hypothetical protein [Patescibacteria group bacterium]
IQKCMVHRVITWKTHYTLYQLVRITLLKMVAIDFVLGYIFKIILFLILLKVFSPKKFFSGDFNFKQL